MEILHNAKYIAQIAYENKYNKKQKRSIIKEHFQQLLEPMYKDLEDFKLTNPESTDIKKSEQTIDNILEIMFILCDRPIITINTILSMLQEVNNNFENFMEDVITGQVYGLYDIIEDGRYFRLKRKWLPSQEILEQIQEFKYLNPMLVPPLQTNQKENNKGGGYLTIGSDSLILGGIHHKYDIDSNLLDTLNNTQWELNEEIIRTIQNEWESLDKPKTQTLDRRFDETAEEYQKRLESFHRYEQACYKSFAEMLVNGNKFYLTHKYDKRGRMYCCGYTISYQGNSYAKSVLNFKQKEIISDEINFFN